MTNNKNMSFKEKYGSYALITGASSGIGKEFAKQLGKKGLNLVLIARRKDKLEEIATEIKEDSKVKVLAISIDLLSENIIQEIEKVTNDIEIGLLVNNAGVMYLGNYTDFSLEDYSKMIDLNVKIPTILTHHFVKKMITRKKGGIVNLAGMVGFMGTPYTSIYAGTKAYELVASEGLAYELKPKGIDMLILNPGLTETEMTANNDFSGLPMKLMKPADVVRPAINALGKKTLITPGFMNKMMKGMSKRIMSRSMNTKMFGWFLKKTF